LASSLGSARARINAAIGRGVSPEARTAREGSLIQYLVVKRGGNVRYGSLADILTSPRHVRSSPQSRHSSAGVACPRCAAARMQPGTLESGPNAVIQNMRLPVVSLGLPVSEKKFPVLVSRELRRQSVGFPGGPSAPDGVTFGEIPSIFPMIRESCRRRGVRWRLPAQPP
jgi:hypothetical protein